MTKCDKRKGSNLVKNNVTYFIDDRYIIVCVQRRQSGLKSWGSWIRVNKISIFPGKFLRNFDLFQAISKIISIVPGNLSKNFIFSGNLRKNRFSRQKLLIYSYFWANYFISLQKSPLSNILPVHNKYNNISRPVHDPHDPLRPTHYLCPKSWGRDPPTPKDWRPCTCVFMYTNYTSCEMSASQK